MGRNFLGGKWAREGNFLLVLSFSRKLDSEVLFDNSASLAFCSVSMGVEHAHSFGKEKEDE
jgi:hypothetical protein